MIKNEFLGQSSNGVFCVEGIDLFKCKWRTTGKCTVVLHPDSKKPYTFSIYETELGNEPFTFAAGEYTTGNWGFYTMME